jgi:hypothetical protein
MEVAGYGVDRIKAPSILRERKWKSKAGEHGI